MSVNQKGNLTLVRLRKSSWDVLVFSDVLDCFGEIDPSYRPVVDGMIGLLMRRVPVTGPPKGELSSDVGDGILEFRRQPTRGPKLRVPFFYDAGRIVVCTHAFQKDTQKMPPEEKQRAIAKREEYFAAKAAGRIVIRDIKDVEGAKIITGT